jgi:hypothetical protein
VSRAKLWDRLFGLRGIYLVSDWLQCILWAFQLVVVGAPSHAISCSASLNCLFKVVFKEYENVFNI